MRGVRRTLLAVVGAGVLSLLGAASAQALLSVESESVSHVTGTDATVEALINTKGAPSGAFDQFQVVTNPSEFVDELTCNELRSSLCLAFGVHAGALGIGFLEGGKAAQRASNDLNEGGGIATTGHGMTLTPGTAYQYRVITEAAKPSEDVLEVSPPLVEGSVQTFTTPLPHYYVGGVRATEGKTYPSISWGTLTLASSNPAIFQPVSCESAIIGNYRNPSGEGAGEGETDLFATTDCVDPECPEEDGLEPQVHSEGLPWPSVLVEAGSKIMLETKDVVVDVGCYREHTSQLAEPFPTFCKGDADPDLANGSGNLSQVASKLIFTGQSEKLECRTVALEGEAKSEGSTEKSVNTIAYGTPVPTRTADPLADDTSQGTLEARAP